MSYGFAVSNDLGRKVIDETHSLHVVVPATVTKEHLVFSEPYGIGWRWYERVGVRITYVRPYKGLEPPMIFMRGNGSHPSTYSSDWTRNFGPSWYNELRFQHLGGPGRWTGAFIGAILFSEQNLVATPPPAKYAGWDLRSYFMVAGTAVDPGPDGYGAVVYDSDGRVVFNSNDNFVEVTGYSNDWQYRGRETYGNEYIELWENPGVVVPSASGQWVSLLPFGRYRRYNGETATVFPSNVTRGYSPHVCVIGGRSGSPFHLPLLTAKSKLPISYTYA